MRSKIADVFEVVLRMAVAIITITARRFAWMRRAMTAVIPRRMARLLMLGIATAAVVAEYFPKLPLMTLLVLGFLLVTELRAGKMRLGLGWLFLLAYYEVYLWALFVIVPIEAFTGAREGVGPLVASVIHCIAFSYVVCDLGATPPPPRRKRRRLLSRVLDRPLEWVNPLPVSSPIAVPSVGR